MKFFDEQLNPNVGWGRHALAIDEHRADFDRVPWGDPKAVRETAPEEPDWLQQFWFAGDHSDIGGSYIENESRLSDISLQWMVQEAQKIPDGLRARRRGPLVSDAALRRIDLASRSLDQSRCPHIFSGSR